MAVYGEWSYCFVCHARVLTSELKLPRSAQEIREVRHPDNVPENVEYIEGLPKKIIRGLDLHYDDDGYYVLWPNKNYWKLRFWEGKSRYLSPRGVKKPLFVYPGNSDLLVVVEGELNAVTLQMCEYGEAKIVSPGSATELVKYINYYLKFKRILIITDKDNPGVVYGLDLKERLLSHNKRVELHLVEKDFNDVFTEEGEEAVCREYARALALFGLPKVG